MGRFPSGIAIAGVGDVDYGALYRRKDLAEPRDPYALGLAAAKAALDDAGLARDEIDGVLCVRDIDYELFCAQLGLERPRFVNHLRGDGRQSGMALEYAAMAVQSGLAECVLVAYANVGRSKRANYGSDGDGADPYGLPHGMTSPGAQVAAMYSRYQHDFGFPEELLGQVAISHRHHASLNPRAVFRQEITLEDYLGARYVTEPLRLFDYCLINDGAVAVIVTTVERARQLRQPVVELVAAATGGDMSPTYAKRDFFFAAAQRVARETEAQSGIKPADVKVAQIYNNFAPTVLFSLEGFGYCERGGAADYIKEAGLTLGSSRCPVNTSGAHTSEAYMQGFNLQVEAVRQVRGECGRRQVPECDVAHYVCVSPIITSLILRRW